MDRINNIKEKAAYFSNIYTFLFTCLLSVMIAIVVFLTGGTVRVFANFMYIPIVITAATLGRKKSTILALFSGFLVGPFMPLDTDLNIM